MASIKIQHCLLMVGFTSLVMSSPAIALVTDDKPETFGRVLVPSASLETLSRDSGSGGLWSQSLHEGVPAGDWAPEAPEVEELPPLALAQVLAQANVVQIVDVELQVTSMGIDVFLRTVEGQQLSMPVTSTAENTFIADIPNAVLSLAAASEFQAVAPTVGIDQVTVVNRPGNQVRITVVGDVVAPTADAVTAAQELVLSFTPGDDVAIANENPDNALRVIVTAQRTEEDVQDVPISITALTDQQIDDADIDTFRGVADNTPNYTVFDGTGLRFFDYHSVRGLSNFNFASRDAIGFFIDDVPYDYGAFLTQNLTDIERIEVLRGPQNTIYGRSSQAGAINVITRRPSDEFEFNGFVSYGSFDNLETQASVSGPVVEEHLFFRLSGNYESRESYYTNTLIDDNENGENGGNVRGQLLWTPDDNWEISFNASYDEYNSDGVSLAAIDDDLFEVAQDVNGSSDLTTNTQSLKVTYGGDPIRFTSITTRRFSNQDLLTDLDQSSFRSGEFTVDIDANVFSQEFRLQSPEAASEWQWLTGLYYESRSFDTEDDGFTFGPDSVMGMPGGSILRFADIDENLFAVFGQASYQPTEALTLTAGLRYETINSTLDSFERILTNPGLPPQTLVAFDDVEQDDDIFLPRVAVEYRFNPNIMAYGSIARGYRPSGVNFRPDNEGTLTFEGKRSWNYEIGVKSSWLDDRLGVNFAAFYNPVKDYQVQEFDSTSFVPIAISNADARIAGFELEARATPIDGFAITAGFGLADAHFTDFPGRPDRDDNALPFAPEFTYNLGLQYRSSIGIFGRLELAGLGGIFFNEDNTLRQDPYAIVNARLGYEFDQYGIYLFANNLFDTEYLTFASPITANPTGLFGTPATFGAQFRAKF
ncbi:MAG: TonB-dependent receptor [Cyanobacteria bacterium P01_F01_bin.150]